MTEYRYGPRHYHHYYHGKPKAAMPWRWIAGLAAAVLIPGAFTLATVGAAPTDPTLHPNYRVWSDYQTCLDSGRPHCQSPAVTWD